MTYKVSLDHGDIKVVLSKFFHVPVGKISLETREEVIGLYEDKIYTVCAEITSDKPIDTSEFGTGFSTF